MEVIDHVSARAVSRQPGKTHRGARNERLRIGKERVQILERPLAALLLHRGGIVEAWCRCLVTLDDAIKIGADFGSGALVEGMTGEADLCRRSALLDGRARKQCFD